MSSFIGMGCLATGLIPWSAGALQVPTAPGPAMVNHLTIISQQRGVNDPIGTCTLRIKNGVAGSEYGVFVQSTNTESQLGGVSSGLGIFRNDLSAGTVADMDISFDYYPPGNINNNIRIRLRKGTSGTKYQPFETLITIGAGVNVAYAAQVIDTIA